jgi:hypothetical protein
MARSSIARSAGIAMKLIPLSAAFNAAISVAFAQGAADPVAHLRACALMEREARLECLDKLSRKIAPLVRSEGAGDDWIISETTSPVDYTPMVTASALSRDGSPMQLTIHCRAGRTELVVSGPAISSAGITYTIAYSVNDGQPVQLASGPPSYGSGAAFSGDVVRLVQSLPEEGHIAIRISARSNAVLKGRFSLLGLKSVRKTLATACKWPQAVARPDH